MSRLTIDPITRIEGHLRVEIKVEDGVIREARCSGALYRGIERILVGRHPLDAQRITTRICGVCPLAHSTAASLCLDDALGLSPPRNGQLLRNLIYGADYLHNHTLHFYHLSLPDYLPAHALPGCRPAPMRTAASSERKPRSWPTTTSRPLRCGARLKNWWPSSGGRCPTTCPSSPEALPTDPPRER